MSTPSPERGDFVLAHKIALDPTVEQRRYFERAAGTARFAYNWALAEWQRQREAGGKPSEGSLRRELNAIKREQFPWMYDVGKAAVQEAVLDLGAAFLAFFEKRGRYPRFKRKQDRASFCAANQIGKFRIDGKRIKLPVIGWIKMREEVRFAGRMKRATISRVADRWFVSVLIETGDVRPAMHSEPLVGVDLGVADLATLSTGEVIRGPKAHTRLLDRLRRRSRAVSRKQKGSANRRKAHARLARLHARVANIRSDALHKLTTRLAKTYAVIGIEDLNVRGMIRNRSLSRRIMDGSFGEFRRQVEYKARLYGSHLVVADRWYPSSKTCSCCGSVKSELALAVRTFRCVECEFEADRDANAAANLAALAASSAVSACGAGRSGAGRKPRVKRPATKQEVEPNQSEAA